MIVVLPNVSINCIFMFVQLTGICSSALSLHISATVSNIVFSPTTRYLGSGARTPCASRDLIHASTLFRPASCGTTAGSAIGGDSLPSLAAPASSSAGNGDPPFVFASRLRTLGDEGVPPADIVPAEGGAGKCRLGVDFDSEGVVDVDGVPGVPRGLGLGLLLAPPGGTGNRRGDLPCFRCSSMSS